jgi:hypothetical protein
MSERKKQIFLEAYKKSKKESVMGKLANGDTDPMKSRSKKLDNLDEVNSQVLWRYIKAMGRDPRTITLNDRLNLARTDRFKKFARDHIKMTQQEETINEAGTGLLMSFIKSKGLDPRAMDGNQKNKYSKSSEFKLFKHKRMEASGMGERGDDWNEETKPAEEKNKRIDELKKQSDTQELDSHITREEKKMKGPDPCWKGYQMVGTKKKGGRTVPNCVPEETKQEKGLKRVNEGIYGIEDSPLSATNSVKAMESKEKSKSARIIKSIYKKKGLKKETIYDWEKTEKKGNPEGDAKYILKGGTTMTGKPRDTIEIEPVVRTKLNSPNGMKANP